MRILFLLLVVGFCLVTAKHIPHESSATNVVLQRMRRSDSDDSDSNAVSVERDDSSNDNDNDDDDDDTSIDEKLREEQNKLREKEEKRKHKEQERLEKERQKEIEEKKKLEEKIAKEERKQQEKHEKEERKLQEKIEKEKHKLEEEKRKAEEKKEKEERKRQEKLKKHLEKIQREQKESAEDSYLESEEEDSVEMEDIWKAHVYDKYGLTIASTKLERQAAIQRYLWEEMGINENSTKSERRQAILKLIQTKLQNDPATVDSFRKMLLSHVNAAQIQKVRVKLEKDLEELNNDTKLLNNISLPWTSVAQQNIEEKKTFLQGIAQFLSSIVPGWNADVQPTNNPDQPKTENENGSVVPLSSGLGQPSSINPSHNSLPSNGNDVGAQVVSGSSSSSADTGSDPSSASSINTSGQPLNNPEKTDVAGASTHVDTVNEYGSSDSSVLSATNFGESSVINPTISNLPSNGNVGQGMSGSSTYNTASEANPSSSSSPNNSGQSLNNAETNNLSGGSLQDNPSQIGSSGLNVLSSNGTGQPSVGNPSQSNLPTNGNVGGDHIDVSGSSADNLVFANVPSSVSSSNIAGQPLDNPAQSNLSDGSSQINVVAGQNVDSNTNSNSALSPSNEPTFADPGQSSNKPEQANIVSTNDQIGSNGAASTNSESSDVVFSAGQPSSPSTQIHTLQGNNGQQLNGAAGQPESNGVNAVSPGSTVVQPSENPTISGSSVNSVGSSNSDNTFTSGSEQASSVSPQSPDSTNLQGNGNVLSETDVNGLLNNVGVSSDNSGPLSTDVAATDKNIPVAVASEGSLITESQQPSSDPLQPNDNGDLSTNVNEGSTGGTVLPLNVDSLGNFEVQNIASQGNSKPNVSISSLPNPSSADTSSTVDTQENSSLNEPEQSLSIPSQSNTSAHAASQSNDVTTEHNNVIVSSATDGVPSSSDVNTQSTISDNILINNNVADPVGSNIMSPGTNDQVSNTTSGSAVNVDLGTSTSNTNPSEGIENIITSPNTNNDSISQGDAASGDFNLPSHENGIPVEVNDAPAIETVQADANNESVSTSTNIQSENVNTDSSSLVTASSTDKTVTSDVVVGSSDIAAENTNTVTDTNVEVIDPATTLSSNIGATNDGAKSDAVTSNLDVVSDITSSQGGSGTEETATTNAAQTDINVNVESQSTVISNTPTVDANDAESLVGPVAVLEPVIIQETVNTPSGSVTVPTQATTSSSQSDIPSDITVPVEAGASVIDITAQ